MLPQSEWFPRSGWLVLEADTQKAIANSSRGCSCPILVCTTFILGWHPPDADDTLAPGKPNCFWHKSPWLAASPFVFARWQHKFRISITRALDIIYGDSRTQFPQSWLAVPLAHPIASAAPNFRLRIFRGNAQTQRHSCGGNRFIMYSRRGALVVRRSQSIRTYMYRKLMYKLCSYRAK